MKTYGKFAVESGGRLAGTEIDVYPPRRDGKHPVTHRYGSGKVINKLYTAEQLKGVVAEYEEQS